ncbi:hypothetical protein WJX73_006315 [Symbiochloris irregularis]|uniref:Uncharacterized protein n=1 Tax=Symbiochloris irregularis TaxID=706552 RepID=A0AAW1PS28_9CHLO
MFPDLSSSALREKFAGLQGEMKGLRYCVRASQTNSGRLVKVVHDTVRRQDVDFQKSLDALRRSRTS